MKLSYCIRWFSALDNMTSPKILLKVQQNHFLIIGNFRSKKGRNVEVSFKFDIVCLNSSKTFFQKKNINILLF